MAPASSPLSVYWYSAAVCRPPICRSCCACRNSRAPEMPLSLGRRRWTICSAETPRSAERLQRDEDGGGVARAAGRAGAGEAEDRGDGGVLLHDALQLGELLRHRREGDRLVGDDLSDHDAGILLGEEGRRQHPEQEDVAHDQADQHEADQQRMVEHGLQPARIGIPEAIELALHPDRPRAPGQAMRGGPSASRRTCRA